MLYVDQRQYVMLYVFFIAWFCASDALPILFLVVFRILDFVCVVPFHYFATSDESKRAKLFLSVGTRLMTSLSAGNIAYTTEFLRLHFPTQKELTF